MMDTLHKTIQPIRERKRFWWINVFRWAQIVTDCFNEIQQLHADLSRVRESYRTEQEKCHNLSKIATESRVLANDATGKLADEKATSQAIKDELSAAKSDLDKATATIRVLENRALKAELEREQTNAEMAKTKSELAKSEFEAQTHKAAFEVERSVKLLLREYVHRSQRLDAPPRNGIRKMMADGKRFAAILLLLLPMALVAQFPPPMLRNSWSTNVAGTPVQGLNNLSITNLGSGTSWWFYAVRPETVARLIDVSNIVGAATGDAGGTNARQFGTLVLTNLSGNPIPYTNILVADVGIALGTNSGITFITNVSATFLTNWANAISNLAQTKQFGSANLTNWSLIPTGEMANVVSVTFLTNWANSISNLSQTKQHGSAVLSNLVGTVANNVTNVVSLSTTNATSKPITNHYENGVLTLFGLEQGANITLTPNGSNIVIASTASGSGLTTNANQFGPSVELTIKSGAFLTNMNFFGEGTNHGNLFVEGDVTARDILPEADNAYDIGSSTMAFNAVFSKSYAIVEEVGNNFISIATPASFGSDYSLILPSSQGADRTVMTNNGSGTLGWFNPDLLLVNVTNLINTKQHGSENLTNWSNIPTGAMANVVSTTFLTNWANSISNLTQTKQHGTASLTNLSGNPNVATNILGAGRILVTSNNAGEWTISDTNAVPQPGEIWVGNTRYTSISNAFLNLRSGDNMAIGQGIYEVPGFIRSGTFDFFQTTNVALRLRGLTNVTINGFGGAIINATNDGGFLVYAGCSNLTLRGIIFRGTQTNGTQYAGGVGGIIALVSGYNTNDNVTFFNCRFESANGFGFMPGFHESASGDQAITRNLNLYACSFYKCGHTNWLALSQDGGAANVHGDALFDGCLVERCGRGVECYGESGALADVRVVFRDCTFRDNYYRDIFAGAPNTVVGLVAERCLFTFDPAARRDGEVFLLTSLTRAKFSSCIITNSTLQEIFRVNPASVGPVRDLEISDCLLTHINGPGGVINLDNVIGAKILRNLFAQINPAVIFLGASDTLIEGNTFQNCGLDGGANSDVIYGRLGRACTNIIIRNNLFLRTAGTGPTRWIGLDSSCRDTLVTDNVAVDRVGTTQFIQDGGVNTGIRRYDSYLDSAVRMLNTNGNSHTKLTYVSDWRPTNSFIFSVTNPVAGQILKFNTVSYSGNGDAQIVVTNASDNSAGGISTNGNQFGPTAEITIKDGALLTNVTHHGTLTVIGNQTNSGSLNVAGGVTNWIQQEVMGTLYASSNLISKAGQSTTNFWPEGPFSRSTTYFTNLNGSVTTFTNLASTTVPAHMLTNLNDTVYAFWEGVTGTALQTTNNFQIVYGSVTLLDTGLQFSSNIIFRAWATITRTDNTAQQISAKFEWVPNALGTTGVPWTTTNENFRVAQTNGIDTGLALRAASRRPGGVTNTFAEFKFSPGPR